MKIIAFINGSGAPSFHRCTMPLLLMPDVDAFITNDLREDHFETKQPDILIYNRVLPDHALPTIAKLKEKYGFKICVDLDDHWELDPHHILYDTYKQEDFARRQIEQIIAADFVTVTHERLADEVKPLNSNVYILPNAIPKQGQFDIERQSYHLTRLFWQGSDTHKEDISLLRTALNSVDIARQSGKIKMVMAGYAEGHEAWYNMVMDYTAGLKHQYKLIPFAPVTNYYQAYEHADICLIPLLNSQFNRHKSNLKVLEAANLGLPVICSPVHPYMDLPVLYAKGTGEWVTHIKRLVGSRKRQKEAGQELKEYVDVNFNFHKINKERKQIFEHQMSLV